MVAVPPDHLAEAIAEALTGTDAVVTDVGSVKGEPLARVADLVPAEALARYVGSHPMAGSERSGPLAASALLFDGRPWAVAPHEGSSPEADRAGHRAGRGLRRDRVRVHPGGARRGRRPHLPRART